MLECQSIYARRFYDRPEIRMLSGLRFCRLHNQQLAFYRSRTPTLIPGYIVCIVNRDSNT